MAHIESTLKSQTSYAGSKSGVAIQSGSSLPSKSALRTISELPSKSVQEIKSDLPLKSALRNRTDSPLKSEIKISSEINRNPSNADLKQSSKDNVTNHSIQSIKYLSNLLNSETRFYGLHLTDIKIVLLC